MGVLANAVKLMQEYKSKHGWVFNAINADPDSGFEGLELETALKHLSEEQRLAQLKATKAWLKATPAARKPLVSKFSKVAAEEAVKALCAALGDAASGKKKPAPPVSLESVSPLLLMRPVTAGEVLDLYAGGDFDLGDRVVMVGDGVRRRSAPAVRRRRARRGGGGDVRSRFRRRDGPSRGSPRSTRRDAPHRAARQPEPPAGDAAARERGARSRRGG